MMFIAKEDKEGGSVLLNHQALYQRLMIYAVGSGNGPFVAQMLSSWMVGHGSLPRCMGLGEDRFKAMVVELFPGYRAVDLLPCPDVEPERASEREDVRSLLLAHRSNRSDEELWIADIVATGCMGDDHLWSDLGLFERRYLSEMLLYNFRPLAEQNTNNMRWKKFFYRQLCAREGFILCRSPSCESCSEFSECFAPEEK
nr:nitrogen fixation protein NifQ [uncultured Cohaesibacter sp.]